MLCSHENCNQEEKILIPIDNNHASENALHPWCIHCGLIKNISEDRPKKIGYWMNILSKISYRFSIPQCQRRLIAKELQSCEEFEDSYGLTGSSQKKFFVTVFQKYCNICKNDIDSFVC